MSGYHKRAIRQILRNKLDALLNSINDEELRRRMADDIFITGGAIASLSLGEKVNDYDVYFRTYETALRVAKYYVARFNESNKLPTVPAVVQESRTNLAGDQEERIIILIKSDGEAEENPVTVVEQMVEEVKTKGFRPIHLTDNAITLTDKMQLVIRFYGEADEIHRNYDYLHCTGVYDYRADSLTLSPEAMECLLSKTLVYNGSLYPLASVLRMRKFIARGWRINAGQVLKMAQQISKIDFENTEVLKEQLMGVDVTYMRELIAVLQTRDPGQRVDATYIASLVDRIFDE